MVPGSLLVDEQADHNQVWIWKYSKTGCHLTMCVHLEVSYFILIGSQGGELCDK